MLVIEALKEGSNFVQFIIPQIANKSSWYRPAGRKFEGPNNVQFPVFTSSNQNQQHDACPSSTSTTSSDHNIIIDQRGHRQIRRWSDLTCFDKVKWSTIRNIMCTNNTITNLRKSIQIFLSFGWFTLPSSPTLTQSLCAQQHPLSWGPVSTRMFWSHTADRPLYCFLLLLLYCTAPHRIVITGHGRFRCLQSRQIDNVAGDDWLGISKACTLWTMNQLSSLLT
jgi:hypothetical protein